MAYDYFELAHQIASEYGIETCTKCECRGAGYAMGHSRAHAHTKEKKICLNHLPNSYKSFFTFLHEVGHCVEPGANYYQSTRAVAEHRATEWAKRKLRELKIPVRRKVVASYDRYITSKVERGLRRGLRVIPAEVRKYVRA